MLVCVRVREREREREKRKEQVRKNGQHNTGVAAGSGDVPIGTLKGTLDGSAFGFVL